MRRITSWIILSLAIGCGTAASLVTYSALQDSRSIQPLSLDILEKPARPVVVAAMPVTYGTVLTADHLKVVDWPSDTPQGAFSKVEDVVGRAIVDEAVTDEPILAGRLAPTDAQGGLSAIIPKGKRALSVRVNEIIGVAGFVLPRTRVDVLVSINPQGDKNKAASKQILQNVEVLAAGQTVERDAEGKPQTVNVITLLVDPAQAEKLTLAANEGDLQLAMRNSLDLDSVDTPGAILGPMVAGPPPVRATRTSSRRSRRPAVQTVEIIKGNQRSTEKF